jgi:ubiquinone/menaquinone biosynthesis C-methylase UbiE
MQQATTKLETGDVYKDEVQNQWDQDPCGSHYVEEAQPDTLEWFLEVERYRYETYAPWMREVMEFDRHAGEKILEIGAGIGTDHAQFAKAGGIMHDLDLASGHLRLAQRNFELRGLKSVFKHGDAENIPFEDNTFDLVYSNGVIHHTPNTSRVVQEIHRVLKPGGRCIIMVYAENSLHYWRNLFRDIGLRQGELQNFSMGEIMSRSVEISESGAKPLVKVYTAKRLRIMFADFVDIRISKRQLIRDELPQRFKWVPLGLAGRLFGWNLIIKARKPAGGRARRNGAGRARPNGGSTRAKADDQGSDRGRAASQPSGLEHALTSAKLTFPNWLERRRETKRQYTEAALPYLGPISEREPDAVKATVEAAANFLAHRFDLLGSGPFASVDPDRPARGGYRPIDWYLDPVRNLRFPRGVPHKEWKLYEMRPANADVKYPWELARSQHWITLAQAWRLTGDDRFAREVADQLDDFTEANPIGIGINWTCTMDVAIRAANWCLSLSLVQNCPTLDAEFWRRAYEALFEHATFIFGNLENHYEVTSNHYLSNVVGLHVLAAEFIDLEAGREWDRWSREALETEMNVQVHEEGTDFESAVPYHRLVTELFMASARLAGHQARPLSREYEAKLARMVDFAFTVTRPDGLMPVIGDADDGRFHIMGHLGGWDRQDGRHLFAPAALLLGRPDWLPYAGPAAVWEATWWGFDPASIEGASDRLPLPPAVKLFPNFGVAVARRGGHYLVVTNGAVGTKGFGNHKHNELLSFEYHTDGTPVVVDPGSFCYTSDFTARNLFRGTAYHNTVFVDDVEQNEINPDWIFRMFEKANPEHLGFTEDRDCVEYRGRHRGYERLDQPVTHERSLRLNRETGLLLIEDRLIGTGEHELKWHFHLAPGVGARSGSREVFELSTARGPVLIAGDPVLVGDIENSWYSPSYGVRIPTQRLALRCRTMIRGTAVWRFALGPANVVEAWRGSSKASSNSLVGASA